MRISSLINALRLVALCVPMVVACADVDPRDAKSPNIILILTDDQGWGATSLLVDPEVPESRSDYFRTPNIERLAAQGMRFTRAYAPHPNCSPSRASIQTGRSPAALHFTDVPRPEAPELYVGNRLNPPRTLFELVREERTLPELIKAARPEYRTAHFGKWHLGSGGPEEHGFDASDGDTKNREGSDSRNLPDDPKRSFGLTRRSIDWMRAQVSGEHPFFLQVSHYAVHQPIQFLAESGESSLGRPRGVRHQNAGFAAMSHDLDVAIGQLLAAVDELGITDETWILFTSDNGTYPTPDASNINGPLRGFKATIWEGGVRVPFIVRGPGVEANSVSRVPLIGYDILPTVCELLSIEDLPAVLEGGSFLPVVLGADSPRIERRRNRFGFHWPHYQHSKETKPSTAWLDLASGYKLHYFWEDGHLELYDLGVDLDESDDLAAKETERASRMKSELDAFLADVDAWLPTPNPDFDAAKDPADR